MVGCLQAGDGPYLPGGLPVPSGIFVFNHSTVLSPSSPPHSSQAAPQREADVLGLLVTALAAYFLSAPW